MSEEKSKREMLRGQVVALVRKFVADEGGMTQSDLATLFGYPDNFGDNVAAALASLPLKFD